MLSSILFCLPGIYLALTGLGAGGGRPSSQTVASTTNAVLYGLFCLFGWIGGAILNLVGPKLTMAFGALGYPLYVGGLWYFDRQGHAWFPYLAGAFLGVTAGMFSWSLKGCVVFDIVIVCPLSIMVYTNGDSQDASGLQPALFSLPMLKKIRRPLYVPQTASKAFFN